MGFSKSKGNESLSPLMEQIPTNAKLFIWFRVLFNCRFYYPVLAVFFIDLGLSVSQYILLNVIWAITIVLLEVPSGALADIVGRKRLVVGAAGIMVVEMALLVCAPVGSAKWLFAVCVVNRVLAGLAEAAASGADEALAYDSLSGQEKDSVWDEVLAKMGRRRAVCMAVATLAGAAVYDASVMAKLTSWLGLRELEDGWRIKIPVFLCLLQGVAALFVAVRMVELKSAARSSRPKLGELSRQTLKAGSWLVTHKGALLLVLGGLIIDAVTRNFATLTSRFYRFLDFPEFSFGFCGFLVSMAGFLVPYLAKPAVRRFGMFQNMALAFLFTLVGLFGLALLRGPLGVVGAVLTMMSLGYGSFVLSKFLNQMAPSGDRATILSVKGLLFNLGYAGFSMLYAAGLARQTESATLNGANEAEDIAFHQLLMATPWAFSAAALVYAVLVWQVFRHKRIGRRE